MQISSTTSKWRYPEPFNCSIGGFCFVPSITSADRDLMLQNTKYLWTIYATPQQYWRFLAEMSIFEDVLVCTLPLGSCYSLTYISLKGSVIFLSVAFLPPFCLLHFLYPCASSPQISSSLSPIRLSKQTTPLSTLQICRKPRMSMFI